jgi:hypothetical protein
VGTELGLLPGIAKAQDLEILASSLPTLSLTKWDLDPTGRWGENCHTSSCHGPAGGTPAAGVGGGLSAGRIPRGTPPNLARRGEIATKTQKLRPALSVNTQPNHVLPLAHFGATYGVCDGGVVRTDRHNASKGSGSGSTQQHDLEVHHAPVDG